MALWKQLRITQRAFGAAVFIISIGIIMGATQRLCRFYNVIPVCRQNNACEDDNGWNKPIKSALNIVVSAFMPISQGDSEKQTAEQHENSQNKTTHLEPPFVPGLFIFGLICTLFGVFLCFLFIIFLSSHRNNNYRNTKKT
jgi:hypothetical protein